MITLYHSRHSTCSQKVRLCLEEKGLAWHGVHLSLRDFEHLRADFLAINPAGLVPVLLDGATKVTESRIINEYLEDAYPQVALIPPSPAARARMRWWTRYIELVPSEAVKLPSFVKNIVPALQQMREADALAMIARIPDPHIRQRWHKAATTGIAAAELAPSIAQLKDMVTRMDQALAEGPWLAGEQLSLADLDIAPFVQRLVRIDLFEEVAARPRVHDWYTRLSSRPAYQAAMPPPGSEGSPLLSPPANLPRIQA